MRTFWNVSLALIGCCTPLVLAAQHAASLEIVSSTTQGRPAGSLVPAPPVVRVRDQSNNPMPGVDVTFALTTGDGSITPSSVTTGTDGTAKVTSWQLGNTPGWNTMTASVRHLPSLTFKIYGARIPTTIASVSARSITGSPGAVVTELPAVIIRDQFSLPMPNERVKFAIWFGNQVTIVVDSTGADGIARLPSWTLSPNAGTNTVYAEFPGLPHVRFVATTLFSLDVSVKRADGSPIENSQICVGAPGYPDFYAKVKSGGPTGRATFSVPADKVLAIIASKGGFTGQTTSYTPPSTGASGAISMTLAPGAGGTICPGASITIDATTQVPIPIERKPTTITPVLGIGSGYGWIAGTLFTYGPAMTVVVRDQFGNPMPGVIVAFAVTSGGGSLTPTSVTTGADGSARPVSWMLGSTPGLNTANATVVGLAPAVLSVSGNLAASSVQAVTAVTQNSVAGTPAKILPGVVVKDQFGNAMSGASVTFAISSGDGSVTPTTPVLTGADGIARATNWMVGTKGPSMVRAAVTRLPAVSFTAEVAEPFTLVTYVKGPDGNAIPSATICVGSGRELAAFGTKSADTNGRAVFTLPIASQYAVTAVKAGYAGQTTLFSPAGVSGNITVRLATGLIGATCSTPR